MRPVRPHRLGRRADPYWVYTDADGTQHYFSKEGGGGAETDGVFRDEDGLGLKMTCQSNPDSDTGHTNFTITDDNGNETFFRDGILTYTKDAYGNGIYYCYNGINFDTPDGKSWRPTNEVFNRLTRICRQNKGASVEYLATLIYDADGRLLRVGDEAGKETKFHYDNTAGVRQLDYLLCPDGTKLNYTYDTTGLNGAHDGEANYGIWYTYHTDGTIDQFYEFTLDGGTHVPGDTVKCWNGKTARATARSARTSWRKRRTTSAWRSSSTTGAAPSPPIPPIRISRASSAAPPLPTRTPQSAASRITA